MLNSATGSRIELSDPIETGAVMNMLFDILYDDFLSVEYINSDYDFTLLNTLVRTARKYEFRQVLTRIKLEMRVDLADHPRNADCAFVIGAALDDTKLCHLALRTGAGQQYDKYSDIEESFGLFLLGGTQNDPSAIPLDWFRTVSHETLWAWCRAHRVAANQQQKEKGFAFNEEELSKAMSKEFARLLSLDGECGCECMISR